MAGITGVGSTGAQTGGEGGDWIQLFNGEDLEGWTPKFSGQQPGENYNDTFRVEDGVLKVDYRDYDGWDGQFGHLFYDDEFSHYVLRAEYRFVEGQPSGAPDWAFRNNGLLVHGQTPDEMEVDQDYPDSIEAQLLGQSADSDAERTTANVCTPGTHIFMDGDLHTQHCTNSDSDTYRGDRWVTVTIVVRGNEAIRHIVEDDGVVMSYTNPQLEDGTPLSDGTVSIQAESHPTEFRSIELKELDPDSPIGDGDPTAPDWGSYAKTELASGLDRPMAIEVAPDGRVLFSTRARAPGEDQENGTAMIGAVEPETGEVTTALELDVHVVQENGLQGIVLDPDFEENGWLYTYYSVPTDVTGDDPYKQLSRFTVDGTTIDPDSEVEILEVPTPTDPCCHVGGDLEFGPEGHLYLSVGDDTSPFESSGYTPIDERDGRALFDAQRSAGNSGDLRGSILRITPQDDGSYAVPDDNMFTEAGGCADLIEEGLVKPEIYVMGCRNPFRMEIDQETGVLYWGDYGPDSREWDAERGPPGIVEFNRATEPGYYGWPYVIGPNLPYVDGEFVDADAEGDFTFDSSGEPFDPQNLVNDSPNNTGLEELPTPQAPALWYTYSWDALLDSVPEYATEYLPDTAPYPEFEGGAPMGGPVYRTSEDYGKRALPDDLDGRHFIAEWGVDWIRTVSYDENGEVADIQPFMPDEEFLSPMDMTIGPDGALYILEWGQGYATEGTEQSGIYRIERSVSVAFDDISGGRLVANPDTTVTLNATITNPFDEALGSGEVALESPDDVDIQVSAVEGTSFDSLAAGASKSASWEVSIPADAGGQHTLTATATYTDADGQEREATAALTVVVGRDLTGEWLFKRGDESGWSRPDLDASDWESVELPAHWEDHSDYTDPEAYGWLRKTVTIPESWEGRGVRATLGKFDDVDETFFNGEKIGQTGSFPADEDGYQNAWDTVREYSVSSDAINYGGENVIAIRGYDGNGDGGLWEGPLQLIPTTEE